MSTFIVTFLVMLIAFAGLAVGVMAGRKAIGGSCGGMGKLGIECQAGCDNPCPDRLAKEQAQKH